MGVLQSCTPRDGIISGSFNIEVFTASLSEVNRFYRGEDAQIHEIYTDAKQFFTEGTYPTDGLKNVLSDVFSRIKGDNSAPAIHRLETAFGGGKTHTLIACTHIAYKGKELEGISDEFIDPSILPEQGELKIVAIAGEELDVHRTVGSQIVPYTLWGEIAYQIGGESLYEEVKADATSISAPGSEYFEKVFSGNKILIMLDELAQYSARLIASNLRFQGQLEAFLLALHGYARSHSGIAIILTLASATDAFADQTERLQALLSETTGEDVSLENAIDIGDRAIRGVASVVARDAMVVVPVQATELSAVLAKRLFSFIDREIAQTVAEEYFSVYQKNASLLPDYATRIDYQDRIIAMYPLHPTLIDFLNNKLATSEGFQKTRGVLRTLALAIRALWNKKTNPSMIHICHLDLRDPRTVNEILGRTGSTNLFPALNADIGSPDTGNIEGGKSNAQLADERNPHPESWPFYEYSWKTVFLNSLVGQNEGLGGNLYGVTEQDALIQVSFPGITPPQVRVALEEINNSAFFLHYKEGRYYASSDVGINAVINRIRKTLRRDEVDSLLNVMARKVVSSGKGGFEVVTDISLPEHLPDKKGKPVLGLISLQTPSIDITQFMTTVGPNLPRIEQNHVMMLVPEITEMMNGRDSAKLFSDIEGKRDRKRTQLTDLARYVRAMQKLKDNPHAHGIKPEQLGEEGFYQRLREREKALETIVTQTYRYFFYPVSGTTFVYKEIKTAGGEGGEGVVEQINKILIQEGKLVTSEHTALSNITSLKGIFFSRKDAIKLGELISSFKCNRGWPMLQNPSVFAQVIRAGVEKNIWSLFRFTKKESTRPEEFYDSSQPIPFDLELKEDYSLITSEGAQLRGWGSNTGPDINKVKDMVRHEIARTPGLRVSQVKDKLHSTMEGIKDSVIKEALVDLLKSQKCIIFKGSPDQIQKPEQLVSGTSALLYSPQDDEVIITPSVAAEKGWITTENTTFILEGNEGSEILFPLIKRIGSLYNRGASSNVDLLEFYELVLNKGGRLGIEITGASPESMKSLGELFEVLSNLVQPGSETGARLEISDPQENCLFLKEIKERRLEK